MTKETLNKANDINRELSDLRSKSQQLCEYMTREGGVGKIEFGNRSMNFYLTKIHKDIVDEVAKTTRDLMEDKIVKLEKELEEL